MARNTWGTVEIEDYDREITTVSINLQNIDAAGSNYGSVTQDLDEIKDSILTVIKGEVRQTTIHKMFRESDTVVTDPEAQRETKWLVTMRDTLEFLDVLNAVPNPGYMQLFTFEVGTADLQYLTTDPASDNMLVSDPSVGFDFITSMAANARSPWNNNPEAGVTPTQIVVATRHVGRAT
jgi:hypothetical protein